MRLNKGVVVFFVVLGVAMFAGGVAMWVSADDAPGSDLGALILGGIGAFYLLLTGILWLIVRRRNRLVNTGVPAMARIISVSDTGTMVNNQPRLALEIEITPADGSRPYRFETKKVVSHSGLAAMRPGATLPVSIDLRRPERFAFIDAAQYASLGGRQSAGADQLQSILQNARIQTSAPTATHSNDDRLGRLERLAALHASGMLSDDEFAAEKQRLLGE